MSKRPNVVFAISKQLGLAALRSTIESVDADFEVMTIDDRQMALHSAFKEIEAMCLHSGIPFNIGRGRHLDSLLEARRPDLCIVAGWYWLVSARARDSVRLGCVGIHNSLLPSYRGGAPLVWSMANGDQEVGTTLFVLSEGLDEGDILTQWRFEVGTYDTSTTLLSVIQQTIATDLGIQIRDYLNGNLVPRAQSKVGVSYSSIRNEEDSRLDWSKPSSDLLALSRALQFPYPRLFFQVADGTRYEVASLDRTTASCFGSPGTILNRSPEGLLVKCGGAKDGVFLTELVKNGDTVDLVSERMLNIGQRLP